MGHPIRSKWVESQEVGGWSHRRRMGIAEEKLLGGVSVSMEVGGGGGGRKWVNRK